MLIITMTTNTKEQLSKGRKDDTSASSSSLQQSLQDNSINTSLIATQPSEQSLCDLDADDISKGAFEQGEERNLMLSATKDSIVCRLRCISERFQRQKILAIMPEEDREKH